jgi:hypothetical protein
MLGKGSRSQRLRWALLAGAACAAVAWPLSQPAPAWAQASVFDSFFQPFGRPGQQRGEPRVAPADYSRAPAAPRRSEPPANNILVLGDSMADWLAYGLENGFAESPEFGVTRRHRTYSGLLRYEPRSETPDWAQAARDIIAAEKPNFIVMMLGLNDRHPIRERVAAPNPVRGAAVPKPATPDAAQPQEPENERQADAENPEPPAAAPAPASRQRAAGSHEFRTEKWAELYSKRIDDTIAALKSHGVPVIWVGLPSIRGQRSTSEASFLNELYRARAEKAGIVYVDVWDGFVDEGGRFILQGPDFEGQTRRLRTSDGVHFTKAGARKLAHYVEREIQRLAARGPIAVALPSSEPQPQTPATKDSGLLQRPLAGPVMPLTAPVSVGDDSLAGGVNAKPVSDHVTVSRVLVKGEAVDTPAGRGDDFAWPRRGVAAFGADPVVATTTLPLPVMQGAPPKTTVMAPTADTPVAAPRRTAQRPPAPPKPAQQQQRGGGFGSFFQFFR